MATKKFFTLSLKSAIKLLQLHGVESTKAYYFVLCLINGDEYVRTCRTSGSGKHSKYLDYTRDTENLLYDMGINYAVENDSPRGGLCGNKIKLITKIK